MSVGAALASDDSQEQLAGGIFFGAPSSGEIVGLTPCIRAAAPPSHPLSTVES